MVDYRAALNSRQLEVLTWICAGSPDGVMDGYSHKTTAVALKSRRLVTVNGRGGLWSAHATEAGRYYLEHGSYPDGFWPPSPGRGPARISPIRTFREPRRDRLPKISQPVPAGEELVSQVLAAGGVLEVEVRPGTDWAARVRSAIRLGRVPEGKLMAVRDVRGSSSRLTIVLVDQPAWMTAVLEPVVVPSRLPRPHPVLAELHRLERPIWRNRSRRSGSDITR